MDTLLTWLAAGAGALFTVAVAVAWWEHLQRNGPREAARATVMRPPVASVDLHVDEWLPPDTGNVTTPGAQPSAPGLQDDAAGPAGAGHADRLPGSDSGARRAALDSAMNRMARPAPWLDTRPTVLTSTAPAPAQRSLRHGPRPGDVSDIDDAAGADGGMGAADPFRRPPADDIDGVAVPTGFATALQPPDRRSIRA